jgi:hypothetical protein
MTESVPSPSDDGGATSSADADMAKSCECHEGVGHYLIVTPRAGLVNQHYAIVHAALLAGAVGADVVVEDMSTRNSFTENVANYVEFSPRLTSRPSPWLSMDTTQSPSSTASPRTWAHAPFRRKTTTGKT